MEVFMCLKIVPSLELLILSTKNEEPVLYKIELSLESESITSGNQWE